MTDALISEIVSLENPSRIDGKWFKDINDLGRLAAELRDGWQPSLGIVLLTEIPKSERKAAAEKRAANRKFMMDFTRGQVVAVGNENGGKTLVLPNSIMQAWDLMYPEDQLPRFAQATCNRRLLATVILNAIALQEGKDEMPFTHVPAEIKDMTALDRITANLQENLKKTKGSLPLSPVDEFRSACLLFGLGQKEAKLMQIGMSRYRAQQFYALCLLDAKFPKMGIASSILNGTRPLQGIDKELIRKLSVNPDVTDSQVLEVINGKKDTEPQHKSMSGKDIESLMTQTPVTHIKLVCKAIREDNATLLQGDVIRAKELNFVREVIMGNKPEHEELRDLIMSAMGA